MSPMDRQNDHGNWVPVEPLEGTFGLRWEMAWRHRRSLGQSLVRAVIGGWRDVRAVDALAREGLR